MKTLASLLLTRLFEGFLIALPVLLVYLMLGQAVDAMAALTVPVTDFLPVGWFGGEPSQRLAAALLLVALFFVLGMAARTSSMQRLGAFIEDRTLSRFPPYGVLKSLAQAIGGRAQPEQLRPGLLSVSPGTRMLVAIVEDLPHDEVCVFVPFAPTPAVGLLQIVSRANVQPIEAPMKDALGSILNWGVGTRDLLAATDGPSEPGTPRSGGAE